MRKIYELNEFANRCGFFVNAVLSEEQFDCNNGYNCKHPEQEEFEINPDTGNIVGKCYGWSCPLGYEPDVADFKNDEIYKGCYDFCGSCTQSSTCERKEDEDCDEIEFSDYIVVEEERA